MRTSGNCKTLLDGIVFFYNIHRYTKTTMVGPCRVHRLFGNVGCVNGVKKIKEWNWKYWLVRPKRCSLSYICNRPPATGQSCAQDWIASGALLLLIIVIFISILESLQVMFCMCYKICRAFIQAHYLKNYLSSKHWLNVILLSCNLILLFI